MSEQDDWAAFVAMMEREGWEWRIEADCFIGHGQYYIPQHGRIGKLSEWLKRDEKHVGDWRAWLAAGSSPVPF